MKNVTIGFSKSTKPLAIGSVLIRWYMGTPYSHVYMKFDSPSMERSLIYEAVGVGVRFIGQQRWETHALEVDSFQLQIQDQNYKILMQFCIDQSGIEYGFWQNLGIVVANVLKRKSNPIADGENCSEAIGEILKMEGFEIEKDLNLLTPKDIHEILSTRLVPVIQDHPQSPDQE